MDDQKVGRKIGLLAQKGTFNDNIADCLRNIKLGPTYEY